MAAVLSTSRYVEPGVYVGEIISPETSNLSLDARVPALIAKGSRLAVARNVAILRAFVPAEQLSFTTSPPFLAPLQHTAKGEKAPPNRLFKADGTELRADEWDYVTNLAGEFVQIQIRDESFDPTATYLMDYQSLDRSVEDQVPLAELRQIRLLGSQIDRAQYREYRDFYVPISFTSVAADQANVNVDPSFSAVTATPQVGSTGAVAVDGSADYTGVYTRKYTFRCTAVTGVTPTRTATFEWSAVNETGGNELPAPVPLHSSEVKPTFIVDEAVPASLVQAPEFGVAMLFGFGATHFVVNDIFEVTAQGASLVEIDSRYGNPQNATITAPEVISGTANDLDLGIAPDAAYNGARNNNFRVKLISTTGVTPNRVLTFVWARYGDVVGTSGTFVVNENNFLTHTPTLANGVKLSFIIGTLNATAGTTWQLDAQSPRIYYTAKDNRNYKLTISTVTNPSLTVTRVAGGYSTNTTEGRFGTFQADFDSTGVAAQAGYAVLPDNVSVAFRNIAQFATLDIFTFGLLNSEVLNWDLVALANDVRQLTDFLTDVNGSITGTAGSKYLILTNAPTNQASIKVRNYNTGAPLSFNWVIGSQIIYFTTDPGVPVAVSYEFRGAEPEPGTVYYMTCLFLRPETFYNTPFLALRLDDGRNFASPSTIDNDLFIANEVAWDNGAQATYLVQPKNQDGSGNFTKPDFVAAIRSMRSYPRITDVCLLNYNEALDEVLNENILANDPFEKRHSLAWVGLPNGTPLGDENTEGTILYWAKRGLQVPGASVAKGTRILVGENRCTKSIVLDNGTTAAVTLDGSFLALAAASRICSFADPATDLLKTAVNGFDSIDLYRQEEIRLLGQAQVLYIKGAPGAYTWGEDTTVDTTRNFERIQLMTQRHYVTKVVNREMEPILGIVPASAAAGRELVRGQLASILRGLLGRGLIGQYQDADGNERSFDPQADIIVFIDKNDSSLYYFNYAWFSRNVIKRLNGLFQLNSNDFSRGVVLA
jgi:hypothetical protein